MSGPAGVLVYHQRAGIKGCHCGWAVPGASHPEHLIDVLREAGWMVVRAEPDGTATVREWSLHDWRLGAREAMNNEQMARRLVRNYEKVQHRTVGPWRDA